MVKGSAEKAEPFILFFKYFVVTSFGKSD
ncbi:Protein of unknown function [Bacillus cereus]|nr:Protein of unknown function [Bacillus cereus]